MLNWIDSHCHLTARYHPGPLANLYQSLIKAGCIGLVLGGVDPEDWQQQLDLSRFGLQVVPIFGLHPWTVQNRETAQLNLDFLALQTMLPRAQGLGECGLDFYRSKSSAERSKQIEWFERQLDLAEANSKPCVLHIVKAHHEALRILKARSVKIKGMVHSFWAHPQIAEEYLDMGLILSLHPRILQLDNHQLLQNLPKEAIVFESDSPELLADGSASDPRLALQILEHAARIWEEDLAAVCLRQNRIMQGIFPELVTSSFENSSL